MMNIKSAAIALVLLSPSAVMAQTETISLKKFVDDPRQYLKTDVRLGPLSCINDSDGFACIAIIDGRALKIDAVSLGAYTPQDIAEKMIGGCKGSANIGRSACRFMVEFIPRSFRKMMLDTEAGTRPAMVVYARDIDFFPAK